MSNPFSIGVRPSTHTPNRYSSFGLSRNPFPLIGTELDGPAPFFDQHLGKEVQRINQVLADMKTGKDRAPLAISGSVGEGKSRVLRALAEVLAAPDSGCVAATARLSNAGFGRASVGLLLLKMSQDLNFAHLGQVPNDVNPLVWAAVCNFPRNQAQFAGRYRPHLQLLRQVAEGKETAEVAGVLLTKWLQREDLRLADQRKGFARKLDTEGELIVVVADLARAAVDAKVSAVFLLIDQLEDLFPGAFTELRRARLLTDLRALFDEITEGAPLGLVVTMTPDVMDRLREPYAALHRRLDQNRIRLPLLRREHAAPFAVLWLSSARQGGAADPVDDNALARTWANGAWDTLKARGELRGSGEAAPSTLLKALHEQVELAAG
jgi:hypothetical protein